MWNAKREITITCTGRPSTKANKDNLERVNCQTRRTVEIDGSLSRRAEANLVRKTLFENGWRNLRTLGERVWTCSHCSTIILSNREKNEFAWGNHVKETSQDGD